MKWLVVSSHDERYDFNLELEIFSGTLKEFEDSIDGDYKKEEKTEWRDGIYIYHTENRSNEYCSNIDKDIWESIKENLEIVTFSTTILIPFEYLNDENFIVQNPIVNRNVKFGFLDVIKNNKASNLNNVKHCKKSVCRPSFYDCPISCPSNNLVTHN